MYFIFITLVFGSLNVLFISVDDLRPQLSGDYEQNDMQTPNIKSLMDQGITFTRAYSQYALDNPSRTSILTGLRPYTTKVYDNFQFFRGKKFNTNFQNKNTSQLFFCKVNFFRKKWRFLLLFLRKYGGKWRFGYLLNFVWLKDVFELWLYLSTSRIRGITSQVWEKFFCKDLAVNQIKKWVVEMRNIVGVKTFGFVKHF